eukprot:PhF_6_TR12975/c0_g1_i1/m.20507
MARVLDIPYSQMGEFLTKEPMNIAVLRLPDKGDHSTQPTGTYDDVKLGRYVEVVRTMGPQLHRAEIDPPKVKDSSFASWSVFPMTRGSNFDQALSQVAALNQATQRALKFKIKFADATEVCFARRKPEDPSSLSYTSTYSPNTVFDQKTATKKAELHASLKSQLRFTVDPTGRKLAKSVPPGPRVAQQVKGPLEYPTPADRAALFQRLDVNGNGMLSLAELDKAVVELWPQFNNKPAIMRAYKAADKNGSGWVGKKEFKYFLKYLVVYNEVWNAFQSIDTSRDRRVTFEEFSAAQKQLRLGLEDNALRAAFSTMDTNGGGYVLFDEFVTYMSKVKTEKELSRDGSAV